jgi:enoyl-CoA hydratase/carnithine racemase
MGRLSPGMAMEMLMTGEPISVQEAQRLGMVNHVYLHANLKGAAPAMMLATKIKHRKKVKNTMAHRN